MRRPQSLHGSYSPFKSGRVREELGWARNAPGKVQGTTLCHFILSPKLLRNPLLLQPCLLARPGGVKRIQQGRERSPTLPTAANPACQGGRRNSVTASQFKREQQAVILLPFIWSCSSICIYFFAFFMSFSLLKEKKKKKREKKKRG